LLIVDRYLSLRSLLTRYSLGILYIEDRYFSTFLYYSNVYNMLKNTEYRNHIGNKITFDFELPFTMIIYNFYFQRKMLNKVGLIDLFI